MLLSGMDDLSLRQFVDMDRSRHVAGYVAALEKSRALSAPR